MKTLGQIVNDSFRSTGRFPRWWILALLQVAAFSVMGELGRPHWLRPVFMSYLVLSAAILGPITAWLWLEIEASVITLPKNLPIKSFTQRSFNAAGIIFCSVILVLVTRFFYANWIFLAIVSSLIAATAILAMLYAVLVEQSFFSSITLAADTWNKKTSFASVAAFILIIAHGASYAIVHGLLGNFTLLGRFSDFNHSATIWILLAALVFFAALMGAFLNCFLVFLFLETIRREKEPETAKSEVVKLEPIEAGH